MIEVAAGVIRDGIGRILITRRPDHVHQGGLWEFPGGKREAGETTFQALQRELQEEVDIRVMEAIPLIKIAHDYGDKQVLLDVWEVSRYEGRAWGREKQEWRWVAEAALNEYAFPVANKPIIKALRLPDYYAILEGTSIDQVWHRYQHYIARKIPMLQLRIKDLPVSEHSQLLERLLENPAPGLRWLINSDNQSLDFPYQGLHLSSKALMSISQRPAVNWVGASCHNLTELQQAVALGLDFAVLSPVQPTTTHPNAPVLGWDGLDSILSHIPLPVYLMGGLSMQDLLKVRQHGGRGVAGITSFLGDLQPTIPSRRLRQD